MPNARLLAQRARFLLLAALVAVSMLAAPRPAGATPTFGDTNAHTVPTFHSIGIYWAPANGAVANPVSVKFRPVTNPVSAWRDGLPLWFDNRTSSNGSPDRHAGDKEYRGSIVELVPDTLYDIQLTQSSGTVVTVQERTWSENFNGQTIDFHTRMPASGLPRLWLSGAADSGTAGNYKIYYAPAGSSNVIDQAAFTANNGNDDNCIILENVHHVIIRGLELRNCRAKAISLRGTTDNIIIEGNDIHGWGRFGTDVSGGVAYTHMPSGDSAIHCANSIDNETVNKIIIQNNAIHDPRWSATTWSQTQVVQPDGTLQPNQDASMHPHGPAAIQFDSCGTNHVIRYNDFYGSEAAPAPAGIKHFQDVFSGSENFNDSGSHGAPWGDTDIYGNRISHAFDDGIEAEGDNRNNRIWGNYLTNVFVPIANSTTSRGPLYVWRNVSNIMGNERRTGNMTIDPGAAAVDGEDRSQFAKEGYNSSLPERSGGRAYYFHNTILQAPSAQCGGSARTCGAGEALARTSGRGFYNFVSRNNVWHVHRVDSDAMMNGTCNDPKSNAADDTLCTLRNDLYNVGAHFSNANVPTDHETGGFEGLPTYDAGTTATPNFPANGIPSDANGWTGNFALKPGTLASNIQDPLADIPNFNDIRPAGSRPDAGAHQFGTAAMKFGRAAAAPVGPTARLLSNPSPASGTAPLHVVFTSSSTAGSAPITNLHLDFGDPGSTPVDWNDPAVTQPHDYAAGDFTATLTVTDANNRTSTATVAVHATGVGPTPPVAHLAASPLSGSAGVTVSFDASTSTPGSAPITGYSIAYGDGASGTGATQSHQYNQNGTFVAVLTVTDGNNLTSTDNKTIQVGTVASAYELYVSVGPGLVVNKTAGERFDFSVEAADGRALQSVRFYVDDVLRATDTAAPFAFSWTTSTADAAGNHALRVEATDAAGNLAIESRPLLLLAASCTLFPSATSVAQGTPLTVQSVCSDASATRRADFSVDGIAQRTDPASPFAWTVDTSALSVGSHTVSALSTFAAGSSSASATVTVTDPVLRVALNPGPTVMWDETITVTASMSDGRALKQVNMFFDGLFRSGTITAPYSFSWTPGAIPLGRHTLFVQATDGAGNVFSATRDLNTLRRSCDILVGTSRYVAGTPDTVYATGHWIWQGQPLTVQALCSNWMTVTQVEFYLDGVLQSTDTSAPYLWTLDTSGLAAGAHTVSITGRIAGGLQSSGSAPIEVMLPQ